jgi:hypothetical protein
MYAVVLTIIGTVAAVQAMFRCLSPTMRKERARALGEYNGLIQELAEPLSTKTSECIERKCEILHSLRFFPRHDAATRNVLLCLANQFREYPRILEEIDVTLRFIEMHYKARWRRLANELGEIFFPYWPRPNL